jgi:hypothetical protein
VERQGECISTCSAVPRDMYVHVECVGHQRRAQRRNSESVLMGRCCEEQCKTRSSPGESKEDADLSLRLPSLFLFLLRDGALSFLNFNIKHGCIIDTSTIVLIFTTAYRSVKLGCRATRHAHVYTVLIPSRLLLLTGEQAHNTHKPVFFQPQGALLSIVEHKPMPCSGSTLSPL